MAGGLADGRAGAGWTRARWSKLLAKLRNTAGRTPEEIEAFERTARRLEQRLRNRNRIGSYAESHSP